MKKGEQNVPTWLTNTILVIASITGMFAAIGLLALFVYILVLVV